MSCAITWVKFLAVIDNIGLRSDVASRSPSVRNGGKALNVDQSPMDAKRQGSEKNGAGNLNKKKNSGARISG